jgi:hypothetical protein
MSGATPTAWWTPRATVGIAVSTPTALLRRRSRFGGALARPYADGPNIWPSAYSLALGVSSRSCSVQFFYWYYYLVSTINAFISNLDIFSFCFLLKLLILMYAYYFYDSSYRNQSTAILIYLIGIKILIHFFRTFVVLLFEDDFRDKRYLWLCLSALYDQQVQWTSVRTCCFNLPNFMYADLSN